MQYTGPPTWWKPKAGLANGPGQYGVKAGWLRACFILAWNRKGS